MPEIVAILSVYYICSADAALGQLSQQERFACNATYQSAKRAFLTEDEKSLEGLRLTVEENIRAYRRLKAWEAENAALVRELKSR